MGMIEEYQRGRRDGIRWAITMLHDEARRMSDPHAKRVLNAAAFHLGTASKRDRPATAVSEER